MNNYNISILNLDDIIEQYDYTFKFDLEIEDVFFNLSTKKYRNPSFMLLKGLISYWLNYHYYGDNNKGNMILKQVVCRSLEIIRILGNDYMREVHDCFMIQAAIISGDNDLILRTASNCIEAIDNGENQYEEAWTGLLKYRVLNNKEKELQQYKIFIESKYNKIFQWPSSNLIKSFVLEDYKTFKQNVKKESDKHWKIAEKDKAINSCNYQKTFNPLLKHDYFFWPWVVATFVKLAAKSSFENNYDSFWLPQGITE